MLEKSTRTTCDHKLDKVESPLVTEKGTKFTDRDFLLEDFDPGVAVVDSEWFAAVLERLSSSHAEVETKELSTSSVSSFPLAACFRHLRRSSVALLKLETAPVSFFAFFLELFFNSVPDSDTCATISLQNLQKKVEKIFIFNYAYIVR